MSGYPHLSGASPLPVVQSSPWQSPTPLFGYSAPPGYQFPPPLPQAKPLGGYAPPAYPRGSGTAPYPPMRSPEAQPVPGSPPRTSSSKAGESTEQEPTVSEISPQVAYNNFIRQFKEYRHLFEDTRLPPFPLPERNTALYKTLQVTPGSSLEACQTSFRKLAIECHPDKVGSDGEKFKRISYAKAILTSTEKKVGYDRFRDQDRMMIDTWCLLAAEIHGGSQEHYSQIVKDIHNQYSDQGQQHVVHEIVRSEASSPCSSPRPRDTMDGMDGMDGMDDFSIDPGSPLSSQASSKWDSPETSEGPSPNHGQDNPVGYSPFDHSSVEVKDNELRDTSVVSTYYDQYGNKHSAERTYWPQEVVMTNPLSENMDAFPSHSSYVKKPPSRYTFPSRPEHNGSHSRSSPSTSSTYAGNSPLASHPSDLSAKMELDYIQKEVEIIGRRVSQFQASPSNKTAMQRKRTFDASSDGLNQLADRLRKLQTSIVPSHPAARNLQDQCKAVQIQISQLSHDVEAARDLPPESTPKYSSASRAQSTPSSPPHESPDKAVRFTSVHMNLKDIAGKFNDLMATSAARHSAAEDSITQTEIEQLRDIKEGLYMLRERLKAMTNLPDSAQTTRISALKRCRMLESKVQTEINLREHWTAMPSRNSGYDPQALEFRTKMAAIIRQIMGHGSLVPVHPMERLRRADHLLLQFEVVARKEIERLEAKCPESLPVCLKEGAPHVHHFLGWLKSTFVESAPINVASQKLVDKIHDIEAGFGSGKVWF